LRRIICRKRTSPRAFIYMNFSSPRCTSTIGTLPLLFKKLQFARPPAGFFLPERTDNVSLAVFHTVVGGEASNVAVKPRDTEPFFSTGTSSLARP